MQTSYETSPSYRQYVSVSVVFSSYEHLVFSCRVSFCSYLLFSKGHAIPFY